MAKSAAPNLAMSNFYGTHQGGPELYQKEQEGTFPKILLYVITIVGLLSLFILIALSVAIIIYTTEYGGTTTSILNTQKSLDGSMKETTGVIIEDLKPKTDLINSMVSFNIPSQITAIQQLIRNDVLKQCTPSFMFNNTICPISENPKHSSYFEEVNLASLSDCIYPDYSLNLLELPEFVEFPSFIPGSTKPASCVRLPSFSLSTTIFAYSHTIMGSGCDELDVGDHYFSIGKITNQGHDVPYFETITEWFINDKINRRSCTVAAGNLEAWMGCVIMTETFQDDLQSFDIGRVTIAYMDVFGRRKQWIYTRNEIMFDYTYTSIYFSVGSGMVVGDSVYFLVWGSLMSPLNVNAYCVAPGCNIHDQQTCNKAQKPTAYGGKQMVNGLLTFKRTMETKPTISVRTFSPSIIPFGTEGRLIHFEAADASYVYLRSTSWHSLPMTGILIMGPPTTISWIQQTAVSRPGEYPCGASNRCPRECITGVYTDLFPLGTFFEHAVTVYLNADLYRVNPTLAFINKTRILDQMPITTSTQKAGYTTTTCFVFKLKIWCLSIVEMSPATITSFEPVPFLYHLDLVCDSNKNNGTRPIHGYTNTYKMGRYNGAQNECYFVNSKNMIYFVLNLHGYIQYYLINAVNYNNLVDMNLHLADICIPALEILERMAKQARPYTPIIVGNWQFTPVSSQNGTRINIGMQALNKNNTHLLSPEDPGHITFGDPDRKEGWCTIYAKNCLYTARDTTNASPTKDKSAVDTQHPLIYSSPSSPTQPSTYYNTSSNRGDNTDPTNNTHPHVWQGTKISPTTQHLIHNNKTHHQAINESKIKTIEHEKTQQTTPLNPTTTMVTNTKSRKSEEITSTHEKTSLKGVAGTQTKELTTPHTDPAGYSNLTDSTAPYTPTNNNPQNTPNPQSHANHSAPPSQSLNITTKASAALQTTTATAKQAQTEKHNTTTTQQLPETKTNLPSLDNRRTTPSPGNRSTSAPPTPATTTRQTTATADTETNNINNKSLDIESPELVRIQVGNGRQKFLYTDNYPTSGTPLIKSASRIGDPKMRLGDYNEQLNPEFLTYCNYFYNETYCKGINYLDKLECHDEEMDVPYLTVALIFGAVESESWTFKSGRPVIDPVGYLCIDDGTEVFHVVESVDLPCIEEWDVNERCYGPHHDELSDSDLNFMGEPIFPFSKLDLVLKTSDFRSPGSAYACTVIIMCGYTIFVTQFDSGSNYYYPRYHGINKSNRMRSQTNEDLTLQNICYQLLISYCSPTNTYYFTQQPVPLTPQITMEPIRDSQYSLLVTTGGKCVENSAMLNIIYNTNPYFERCNITELSKRSMLGPYKDQNYHREQRKDKTLYDWLSWW
uniref:Hemagglutinin-neuraminidase n=1 Tax=Otomys rat paramyxovirus TaxID=3141898 RepID=A0AAU7E2A9_9MONO